MQETTTTSFKLTHEGQVYDVSYTVCADCLGMEISALLARGETERQYGAGKGAFTLSVQHSASATPSNGAVHEATA